MDRHKSKSRQYIDRRERLGRVNSGETFMSRLGVLPSAATTTLKNDTFQPDENELKNEAIRCGIIVVVYTLS